MTAGGIGALLEIMARLRDPARGCPWDIAQSFATIAPYTIEEAYEVADAIDRGDYPALRDELGDLLLQVVFHAQMAAEAGHFDFSGVVSAICEKMVRRHPHVFADAEIADAAAQTDAWERHKAEERLRSSASLGAPPDASALAGIAAGLPSLVRALKLQKRAAAMGFDWPDAASALAKIGEEADELADEMANGAAPERLTDEMGDLLFAAVNVCRKLDLDPETVLRQANAKFERRFRAVEEAAGADPHIRLTQATPAELDALWQRAKAAERR